MYMWCLTDKIGALAGHWWWRPRHSSAMISESCLDTQAEPLKWELKARASSTGPGLRYDHRA